MEKSTNKEVVKFLIQLRNMMLEVSRHYNTNIISVSHNMLVGNTNSSSKTEMTGIFLYPGHNQPHQTREFLKKYVGLSKVQIEEIMKLRSRWVYVSSNSPNYYISQKICKLLV